jgi:hypothetical protein
MAAESRLPYASLHSPSFDDPSNGFPRNVDMNLAILLPGEKPERKIRGVHRRFRFAVYAYIPSSIRMPLPAHAPRQAAGTCFWEEFEMAAPHCAILCNFQAISYYA